MYEYAPYNENEEDDDNTAIQDFIGSVFCYIKSSVKNTYNNINKTLSTIEQLEKSNYYDSDAFEYNLSPDEAAYGFYGSFHPPIAKEEQKDNNTSTTLCTDKTKESQQPLESDDHANVNTNTNSEEKIISKEEQKDNNTSTILCTDKTKESQQPLESDDHANVNTNTNSEIHNKSDDISNFEIKNITDDFEKINFKDMSDDWYII